jgi:hypothetical protein
VTDRSVHSAELVLQLERFREALAQRNSKCDESRSVTAKTKSIRDGVNMHDSELQVLLMQEV